MASLRHFLILGSVAFASPAQADDLNRWQSHIAEASQRFGIPEPWIRRVMRAESGGKTMLNGRPITSKAGAMGLMQIMPGTWRELRFRFGLGADPHRPRDNILGGAAYLRMMYDRFGYPGLFAAYNAGPARYAAHLATGHALPAETRAYLAITAGPSGGPAVALSKTGPSAPIFHQPGGKAPRATDVQDDLAPDPLFSIRNSVVGPDQ